MCENEQTTTQNTSVLMIYFTLLKHGHSLEYITEKT